MCGDPLKVAGAPFAPLLGEPLFSQKPALKPSPRPAVQPLEPLTAYSAAAKFVAALPASAGGSCICIGVKIWLLRDGQELRGEALESAQLERRPLVRAVAPPRKAPATASDSHALSIHGDKAPFEPRLSEPSDLACIAAALSPEAHQPQATAPADAQLSALLPGPASACIARSEPCAASQHSCKGRCGVSAPASGH